MSNVKLQGNVSGTGSVTITSPNTNSDRTITLPDSSGTFVVDGASQSPTFNAVTTTTLSVAGNNISAVNGNWRNRIINGDMRIDQRNAGASVSNQDARVYTLDRWASLGTASNKFTVQQSSVAPSGFVNSLLVTSSAATSVGSSDYYFMQHFIEGFNIADLGWGTANAQPVTLSFQVRSSLTGTFGCALQNSAQDRSYPFSYTISAANTWETKTVTIAGDTTGTWLTTNGRGISLIFGLGIGSTLSGTAGSWSGNNFLGATGATSVVGTNGATFYITGVQLEAGSVASPFERRDYGRELMMCMRYCLLLGGGNGESGLGAGIWYATTATVTQIQFPVQMRANPTLTYSSVTVLMYYVGGTLTSNAPSFNTASTTGMEFYTPVSSGSTTAGFGTTLRIGAGKCILSSEL